MLVQPPKTSPIKAKNKAYEAHSVWGFLRMRKSLYSAEQTSAAVRMAVAGTDVADLKLDRHALQEIVEKEI
jgi:hypothetical protein